MGDALWMPRLDCGSAHKDFAKIANIGSIEVGPFADIAKPKDRQPPNLKSRVTKPSRRRTLIFRQLHVYETFVPTTFLEGERRQCGASLFGPILSFWSRCPQQPDHD